jgi:hypothetical protein
MTQPGPEDFKEIRDVEAAQLALRGAVATIRDLQEKIASLKGGLQEAAGREKAAKEAAAALRKELASAQAEALKREGEARTRLRLEVREEMRAQAEREHSRQEGEIARLASQLEEWRKVHRRREEEWEGVRKLLDRRESELVALQREKLDILGRVRSDSDMVQSLRERRDEEILQTVRGREAEISELRGENSRLCEALSRAADERGAAVAEIESRLRREAAAREASLRERYCLREAELEKSFGELENGLWQRAREAREKLDATAQAQFDERARQLADRSAEIEAILERRKAELEAGFEERRRRLDARLAELERSLRAEAAAREADSLARAESGLREREEGLRRREEALEEEARRLARRAEEDACAVDARLKAELLARERVLEEAFQRRRLEMEEKALAAEKEQRAQWTQRKMDLLSEHERACEAERASLAAQFSARGRALEESYAARVAGLESAHASLEEQFRSWKAVALDEGLQKEKNLDKQWALREQDLVRRYETALEQQRRSFVVEADKMRRQYDSLLAEARAARPPEPSREPPGGEPPAGEPPGR